jgi:hypothetical protein
VLEGSVRRAGASLRVTTQLVDAETDSPVWAEKYSGTIEDVFAIQEEISRKIVTALHVKLTDSESRAVAERPIDDPVVSIGRRVVRGAWASSERPADCPSRGCARRSVRAR